MPYNYEFQTKSGFYFKSIETLQNSMDSCVADNDTCTGANNCGQSFDDE